MLNAVLIKDDIVTRAMPGWMLNSELVHRSIVIDCQIVDAHCAPESAAVNVLSAEAKFRPIRESMAAPECGVFPRELEARGASKLNVLIFVPLRVDTVITMFAVT